MGVCVVLIWLRVGYEKLSEDDLLKLNDLNSYGLRERHDLKLTGLQDECWQACQRAVSDRTRKLVRESHHVIFNNGLDAALVELLGGEEFVQRNAVTEGGYLAHFIVQFDEMDRPVPFTSSDLPPSLGQLTVENTGLPPFSLMKKSCRFDKYVERCNFQESSRHDQKVVDGDDIGVNDVDKDEAGKSGSRHSTESRAVQTEYDEPVRRLCVRFMPKFSCVYETERPAARTLMDLLQVSAAGWSVAGVSTIFACHVKCHSSLQVFFNIFFYQIYSKIPGHCSTCTIFFGVYAAPRFFRHKNTAIYALFHRSFDHRSISCTNCFWVSYECLIKVRLILQKIQYILMGVAHNCIDVS